MAKKAKVFNRKSWIIAGIRRLTYRYPARWAAKKASRIGRNQYVCAMCPEGITHGNKGVQMDHVIPIVDPTTGFTNWNDFVERALPDVDGWQVLCREHHKEKTLKENSERKRKGKQKNST